jgi:hypothetical protein
MSNRVSIEFVRRTGEMTLKLLSSLQDPVEHVHEHEHEHGAK